MIKFIKRIIYLITLPKTKITYLYDIHNEFEPVAKITHKRMGFSDVYRVVKLEELNNGDMEKK